MIKSPPNSYKCYIFYAAKLVYYSWVRIRTTNSELLLPYPFCKT